jgi:hypothetical protein
LNTSSSQGLCGRINLGHVQPEDSRKIHPWKATRESLNKPSLNIKRNAYMSSRNSVRMKKNAYGRFQVTLYLQPPYPQRLESRRETESARVLCKVMPKHDLGLQHLQDDIIKAQEITGGLLHRILIFTTSYRCVFRSTYFRHVSHLQLVTMASTTSVVQTSAFLLRQYCVNSMFAHCALTHDPHSCPTMFE